jgi:D-alanyl-D-alanine carboxypeptidase
MTRAIVSCLTGLSLVAGFVQAASPQRVEGSDRLAAALQAIDVATADLVPAFVVAVTDRRQTLGIVAHGYSDIKAKVRATPDTLFEIGSISKSFTAMALMQLVDEGRLDPQAPVTRYLPWFSVRSTPAPITVHHVLTHTAGLPNYRADVASSPFATYALRDFDVPYAPGSHYWYSNLGFQTLGYVLEQIDGGPYHAIIERRILKRIEMNATTAAIDDPLRLRLPVSYSSWPYSADWLEEPWFEYRAGDGSIASTAADMAAYVRVILNRGALPNGRVISERAFTLMTTPALENYAYGLRVQTVDGDTVIGHGGAIAGFNAQIEAHMNDGYGVVMLTNGPTNPVGLWILNTIKAAVRNQPLPTPPARRSGQLANASDWAGVYQSPEGGSIEFVAANDALSLKRDAGTIPLTRVAADGFRASTPDLVAFPFIFERQGGKVVEVSHGPDWYFNPLYTGPKVFEEKPGLRAYVGRYENHNPESSPVRVFVNRGQLIAASGGGAGQPLAVLGPALFKPVSPDFNPERYSFDSIVDGHALRLTISGMPLYRIDDR